MSEYNVIMLLLVAAIAVMLLIAMIDDSITF